jgi:hypothetical protein
MLRDQARILAYGAVSAVMLTTLSLSSQSEVAADPQPFGPDT